MLLEARFPNSQKSAKNNRPTQVEQKKVHNVQRGDLASEK
jgi:hypothetical protein